MTEAILTQPTRRKSRYTRSACVSHTYFVDCAKVFDLKQEIANLEEPLKERHTLGACPVCQDNQKKLLTAKVKENLKRIFDCVVAGSSIIFFLPLMAIIALLVKVTSPGPIFYKQERLGKDAKPFYIFKFRSMASDAESKSGPVWAGKDDPRITPFGKFLRKSHLDELPQLFNVIAGDMSVVGPRPERPYFVSKLHSEIPDYHKRLLVKPGITGLAQVRHSYDATIQDVRKKVKYDLAYIKKQCLLLDVKVMVWTVGTMVTGKGAH
jgi:exopolysaccharide biosynthesis polyprenyl glycosylphosphotransferase